MTSPSPVRSNRFVAVADEPEPARLSLARIAAIAAAALALAAPGLALAQESQQSNALTQQELNQINNQPIAPAAKSQLNQPRQPSFQLNERDGTQVREYRNKGRATDIQVQSGFGTKYEMSKPEDSSPRIREHDVNRVPSVNLKF
ncbi:membrane protein [Cupriavidus necator]|uniref:membrane protein n=1 Tax=Cupriavidus necator TaxID=106590 RepID=UPI0005B46BF5|nr:membrane protein [Cupriavidus necator]